MKAASVPHSWLTVGCFEESVNRRITFVALVPCLRHDLRIAAVLEGGAEAFTVAGAAAGAAGAEAAALAYDCLGADAALRAGGGLGARGGGRVGDRGGLGGGNCGFVSGSADCTATGTVGAGRDLGAPEGVPAGVRRRKRKRRLARSRRRDIALSSRAWRSSWSLLKSAKRRLLTLGGTAGDDVAAATSAGSICGKVISGSPAGAGEPSGEFRVEAAGVPWGADSKGSSWLLSASRATRLAAARRRALAASMSLGGGGKLPTCYRTRGVGLWDRDGQCPDHA